MGLGMGAGLYDAAICDSGTDVSRGRQKHDVSFIHLVRWVLEHHLLAYSVGGLPKQQVGELPVWSMRLCSSSFICPIYLLLLPAKTGSALETPV